MHDASRSGDRRDCEQWHPGASGWLALCDLTRSVATQRLRDAGVLEYGTMVQLTGDAALTAVGSIPGTIAILVAKSGAALSK